MRSKSLLHVVLGFAMLLPAAIACGSGAIESDTGATGSNWENHPGDFATPTQNNQQSAPYPGVGGKPAPAGGGAACPCGNNYACSLAANGKTVTETISLDANEGGQCTVAGDKGKTVITCDGKLVVKGTQAGTWAGNASQFTLTFAEDNQSVSLTCVKTAAPVGTDEPADDPPPVPTTTPSRPADAG